MIPRDVITVTNIYTSALIVWPSVRSLCVSKENVEYVVKPPQKPVINNALSKGASTSKGAVGVKAKAKGE